MNRKLNYLVLVLLLAHGAVLNSALRADEKEKKIPEMTQEQRSQHAEMMEKMAEAHKKMAECLKSSKTTAECHEEWHKEMKETCPRVKEGHCPAMGGMKWHHSHPNYHEKQSPKK
ncbi:MAG: hypothetical protein ACKOA8_01310 [Deltaproteobacteria bacterium]